MIAYLWRAGMALDIFLNVVLLGGAVGETISLHVARDAARGRWPGCVMCRWLSLTVERDHCSKVLAGVATSPRGGLIAGLQLLALFLLLTGSAWSFILR